MSDRRVNNLALSLSCLSVTTSLGMGTKQKTPKHLCLGVPFWLFFPFGATNQKRPLYVIIQCWLVWCSSADSW